jgi:PAS domain S-box-containing protein
LFLVKSLIACKAGRCSELGEPKDMDYQLSEIFDLEKFKELMESFHKVSGVSSGVVDHEGSILIKTGWQDICTQFHRRGPVSQLLCNESDRTILAAIHQINSGEKQFIVHKCINGLYFAVSPIEIRGIHLGNFMFGQFFIEAPDLQEFSLRAKQLGFPEKDYFDALKQVPVFDIEKLESIIRHFRQFAEVLGEMGLNRIELLEAKRKEVLQAKNQLKMVLNNLSNIGVRICDSRGKVLYWNLASTDFYGWKEYEALGKSLDKLILDKKSFSEFLEIIKELAQGNVVKPKEWVCKGKEGNERIVFSTIIPIWSMGEEEFICLDIDTTERKLFEKELARLDRLNLVGELAASISHEVRNPMTTVRGFLQVLSEKPECQPYHDYYELMIQELDRANSIITEFLSLAKNKPIQLKRINLNQILHVIKPLIEANAMMFNQSIEIVSKRTPKLKLDEKEIRQLILNLVRNAMEAMEAGGRVTIKTYCEDEKVILSVGDNGPGIDPTILDKLGTPFITTKTSGTGLGLPVCYSIALRHEAMIEVKSSKAGTTFLVKFKR